MNTNIDMTFDENYGYLPKRTLRLIKRYNVSPADFDVMQDLLGFTAWLGVSSGIDWPSLNAHIISNSETGIYRPRVF